MMKTIVRTAVTPPSQNHACPRALLVASIGMPLLLALTNTALSQAASTGDIAGIETAAASNVSGTQDKQKTEAPAAAPTSNGSPKNQDTAAPAPAVTSNGSPGNQDAAAPLPAPMPSLSSEPDDPKKVLLDQAAYWRSRSQPARAIQSLERLTALDESADTLALLARAQIEDKQIAAAKQTIEHIRKINRNDPRIAEIEHDLQVGQPNQAQLEAARSFAQEGRTSQAVKTYQEAFKGATPPSQYAFEYYLTLGGTPAGFDAARKKLGQIVAANPRDLSAQVAYAKLLSYDEGTRDEAIKRLALLSQSKGVSGEADDALRQALQWLPDTSDSLDAVEAYAKRHPNDAVIAKKLALIRNPPMSPTEIAGKARMSGYDKMDKMLLAEAEDDFKKALAINPDDPDATAGLGFLRIKQGRIDEGRDLLKHAKELGPTDEEGIDATLKSLEPTGAGKVDEAALREIRAQYVRVATLTKRKRYAEAEALLRHLGGSDPNWGYYLQMGGIEAQAGQLSEAEDNYRHALKLKPGNPAATIGLAGLLLRQHHDREAEALYAQVGDTKAVGQIRAERLRSEARHVLDPVAQAGLYRQAVQADPSNPWLRLELARALLRQGRGADARSVMATVGERGSDEQAVEAAFYFAVEVDNLQRAAALVERIPAAKRTPQMVAVQERVAVRAEIAQAAQDANGATLRLRLLSLAAAPDPSGARVEEIARTLVALNDRSAAADAVATALATNPDPDFQQRIAYASALAGADRPMEGERLLAALDESSLSRDQRKALSGASDNIAVAVADSLRFDSRYGEAAQRLSQRLAVDPTNPSLNMALARLYISQAQLGRAVTLTQALLERNPDNLDVLRSAVDALVAVGDLDRADALAQEGIRLFPGDASAYMIAAHVARRRDDDGRVVQDLRMAKQLLTARAAEGGAGATEPTDEALDGAGQEAGQPGGALVAGSANAFRPGPLAQGPSGPVPDTLGEIDVAQKNMATQRIETDIATLQDEVAPQVRAGFGYLARSGEDGLSRLSVITTPLETSFSPGGIGILRAQVTPTIINGNTPHQDSDGALQSFGTNPLRSAFGLPLGIAGDQAGTGAGLDLSYTYRFINVDIGSTPLGFLRSNVVGGVELAPLLTPELRLRLTADRRAVVNSVLSYAGARDPATGQVWGAVVANRGFAQLEWAPGRWFAFAGAGGGVVTGDQVRNNSFTQAIVGASYGLYQDGPAQFRVGVNVPYFNYAQNQNAFSFGNGGYFSPQNFVAVLPTFAWQDQPTARLSYKASATVGYQSFAQKASQVFPDNAGLQSALLSATSYPGMTEGVYSQGLSYGAQGEFEYKISDEWRFGARAAFQKAGDYTEGSGVVYGRYVFNVLHP